MPTAPCPEPGDPTLPGATVGNGGTGFCVHAPVAERIELLFFAAGDDPEPSRVLELTAPLHRRGDWWHTHVPGVGHGQVYGWRTVAADGKRSHLLVDPWARAVTGLDLYDRAAARASADNTECALRSVVIEPGLYDWQDDRPPAAPLREVVYEMHVAAFTRDPSSGVPEPRRGTYAGVADRLDHLVELGVTTVELLPVQQFDPQDAPAGRVNYWGYSPVAWCAPHAGWAADRRPAGPVDEFRDMVKAIHRKGLRVVLDVVFNHTAEGEADGPVLSWRGLDPATWYLHDPQTGVLIDHTGCGNTVDANGSIPRRLVLDSLRWWTEHMHVDGFRFDLASALARGTDGAPLRNPPLYADMAADPVLADSSLVVEPWDVGGHSLVGKLPGRRFAVWNGEYRDTVRRFWRGDEGTIESLMARLVGSPDLAEDPAAGARQSVNFITAHDGFCLADLVAYERKRNEANGEDNRDGSDNNLAWNCGHEGPDAPPKVLAIRRRQARNLLATLLLSHGTPMLLMGDEMGATRRGNNNPWCQDNDFSWLDWRLADDEDGLLRFARKMIRFTTGLTVLRDARFWHASDPDVPGQITWHGTEPGRPDWRPASHTLAWTLTGDGSAKRVHIMANASPKALEFTPPTAVGAAWRQVVDTAASSPADMVDEAEAAPVTGPLIVAAHGLVVLIDDPDLA
ncbi:MAG: glycogen-debranching protein [bacterium]|nr:glycogen-debranching protein [bacterium]